MFGMKFLLFCETERCCFQPRFSMGSFDAALFVFTDLRDLLFGMVPP